MQSRQHTLMAQVEQMEQRVLVAHMGHAAGQGEVVLEQVLLKQVR